MTKHINNIILCDYANPDLLADFRRMILGEIRYIRERRCRLVPAKGEDMYASNREYCTALIERFELMGGGRVAAAAYRRALRLA